MTLHQTWSRQERATRPCRLFRSTTWSGNWKQSGELGNRSGDRKMALRTQVCFQRAWSCKSKPKIVSLAAFCELRAVFFTAPNACAWFMPRKRRIGIRQFSASRVGWIQIDCRRVGRCGWKERRLGTGKRHTSAADNTQRWSAAKRR